MGTLSQGSPDGTLTGLGYPASLTFDGAYFRDLVDEPLGVLERYEIILYEHLTDHIGETALWTFRGNIDTNGVELDTFSITQFLASRLQDGDYCWSVRLRDRLGEWTATVHEATFSLSAAAPVLSDQWPDQAIDPSLEAMAGTRFSAVYSDSDGSPAIFVLVQLVEQVASEGWEDATYTTDVVLWRYDGPPRSPVAAGNRIEVRYSGRTLPDNRTYLWRMKALNQYAQWSNWIGGQFTLIDRVTPAVDPVSTTTDTFTQVWETDIIAKPVGLWYDPGDPDNIRVVDRQSLNIATLRRSDRTIVATQYIGDAVAYPAGMSGDPSDATSFWLLRAPWTSGGGLDGNRFANLAISDLSIIHNFNPGSGRWTAIKVSASWLYATNWDDGKIYRYNKSTGALDSSWNITYETVEQTKPTGIMVDGTTLYYFFYNDGDTKRFLVADESDPTTITGAKSTEGLAILGGEMDTTTHTEMFGDSDSLGKVWEFTLKSVIYGDGIAATRLRPSMTTYGDA
jgi:hypothetical protein